jgi:hypothetical protein
MTDHIRKTIEDLQSKLVLAEGEVKRLKKMINELSVLAGSQPVYSDVELESKSSISTIRSDQFYGKSIFAAIRELLILRKDANVGPASVAEIHETLVRGGFKFDAKDDDNAKRGIRISLTKNTGVFHKLPNGLYGLLTWYPNAKPPKKADETPSGVDEAKAAAQPAPSPSQETENDSESHTRQFGHANAEFEDEIFRIIDRKIDGEFRLGDVLKVVGEAKPELAGRRSTISFALSGLVHAGKIKVLHRGRGSRPGIYRKV